MNKVWVGAGAAILSIGAIGGYCHFSRILPERVAASAPADTTSPEAPEQEIAATAPSEPPAEASGSMTASPPTTGEPSASSENPAAPEEPVAARLELLRVEPDGSAVFAGRVAPGSRVEILNGDEVLASETADASGDFVATLGQPLPVGDHELTLRTTTADGVSTLVPQVAIVSIPPAGQEGDLLVALGTPDGPTQLIQTPEAPAATPSVPAEERPVETASPAPDASSAPAASVETAPLRGSQGGDLAIGAVEIEGDRVYVAGTARPGTTIRIYLDDQFVAEADGTGDQFIAEAIASVAVGSHVVRADEIGPDGSVVARVEVPFERPDGESMAALAPGFGRSDESGSSSAPAATPTTAAPETPAVEAPTMTPDTSSADATPSAAPGQAATPSAEVPSTPTEPDVSVAAAPGRDAPASPSGGVLSSPPAAPTRADPAATEPNPAPEAAEPLQPAARQAALEPVDGRVIIRRGDTLWRISRETYGLGRRYTTIYLANGDQIRDPDLIYPGQIFRLPEEAEGENAR